MQEALISAARFYREWSKGVEYSYPEYPLFGRGAKEPDEDDKMLKNKERFLKMVRAVNTKLEAGEEPPQEG